jgi:hypothetical protein
MDRSWHRRLAILALALAVASSVGCGSQVGLDYEENGTPLMLSEAEALARQADLSPAAGIDVAHAPDARVDVLVGLRSRGAAGDRAASLLTQGFPERTAAVPVLVRIASVNGTRSVVVVEAVGDASGELDGRRLWVFEYASGRIVLSSVYR